MTNEEFEKIYQTYFKSIYLYLLKLSGNEEIAEEITSETFFKALGNIDSFKGECSIQSWLCQIAKNTYFSYYRKEKRNDSIDELTDISDEGSKSVEQQVMETQIASDVYQVLHTLDEPYKEVFMLRVLGELSFKQIGKLFGKTENWACVTFYRAKIKIQKEMED